MMKLYVAILRSILALTFIFTIFQTPHIYAADKPLSISYVDQSYFDKIQENPKRLVEEYCKEVFNGSEDIGIKLAKLSPERAKKEQKLAPKFGNNAGKIKFLDDDPLVVVKSYKIVDVKITKDNGEATVFYKKLAYTRGGMYDREYVVDKNDNLFVKYNLRYVGDKWWIIDPPLSYVSRKALIDSLSQQMKLLKNVLKESDNSSEAQRNAASSLNRSVKILTELK